MEEIIEITEEESGRRIDCILAERYKEANSRSYFQMLIQNGHVSLNGGSVKKNLKPKAGDKIEISFVLPPEISLAPEDIPLNIIYEDDHIFVVNKSAGMVVHPAPGNWKGTFVNALLHHCRQLPGSADSLRPGIVHRLDKDTSGLLVSAKTPLAHQRLIEMFSGRKIHKRYFAICLGNPGYGELAGPIGRHPVDRKKMAVNEKGGKEALTRYRTLAFDGKLSLVDIEIETGRTHQIRVHLSCHRTPVLGDSLYGNSQQNKKYSVERQMLHAYLMRFNHPITSEVVEFKADLPPDMQGIVQGQKGAL